MRVVLFMCVCIATVQCIYDEYLHNSEPCEDGFHVPHCFVTPCMLEEKCTNYPDAECSNNYCYDNPCSTVWRYNGEKVDCGNYQDEWDDDWDF